MNLSTTAQAKAAKWPNPTILMKAEIGSVHEQEAPLRIYLLSLDLLQELLVWCQDPSEEEKEERPAQHEYQCAVCEGRAAGGRGHRQPGCQHRHNRSFLGISQFTHSSFRESMALPRDGSHAKMS